MSAVMPAVCPRTGVSACSAMAVSITVRNGCCQLFAVLISAGILLLFGLLAKYPITIPTKHSVTDAQQVVNLLTIIVASCFFIFMNHCFSIEAKTAADLHLKRLTLPRLQIHTIAQNGSLVGLAKSIRKHPKLRLLSAFYLASILALSGLSTVLGVIFVLDTVQETTGVPTDSFPIALSADIPARADMCSTSLSQGTCAYDLATSALSSQLITHTPYTMAGVTFSAPNGTFGIPYGALEYFAATANSSRFGDEKRQYCLPVLNPKLVSCAPDDTTNTGTKRAFYDVGHVLHTYDNATWIYPVTIDPDSEQYNRVYIATMTGYGTMTIAQSAIPGDEDTTIITAQGSYAKILSNMMNINSTDYYFTAICSMSDLTKTKYSSWKWTSLTLENGVQTVDVTEESCRSEMEAKYFRGITGFASLPLAIQATTKILGGVDGYSKLINYDSFNTSFSQLTMAAAKEYASTNDMTLLESTLSQLYGIVQTSWTALDNHSIVADRVQLTNIFQRDFPHNFIIKTFWTPSTIIALILAALILLFSVLQAIRWLIAIRKLGKNPNGWQLLEPVGLMTYSFRAIDDDVGRYIGTAEAQRTVLWSKDGPTLIDYPKGDLSRLTSPKSSGPPVGKLLERPLADNKEGLNVEEVEKSGASSKSPSATEIRSLEDDKKGPTVTEVRKSGTSGESPSATEIRSLEDDEKGPTVTEVRKSGTSGESPVDTEIRSPVTDYKS